MKKTISISYDLVTPGRDYKALHNAIQQISPQWAKPLESQWLTVTTLDVGQVRDKLLPHMDRNDRLLVMDVGPGIAWFNIVPKVVEWLKAIFG